MMKQKHDIKLVKQPTANTCGYAALSTLLSASTDNPIQPMELVSVVPQPKDEEGTAYGSISSQLALWCVEQGYTVDFYTFDFQILDLTWQDMSREELIKKLDMVRPIRSVDGLGGAYWTKAYIDAYLALLNAGGNVHVRPHVTTDLINELLMNGPILANISSAVVYGHGRQTHPDSQKPIGEADDINGTVGTHSVVIYGHDQKGTYFVADPWRGYEEVDAETLLCGVTAAQIECDAQLFQIKK
jgi:hypothetical protein